MSSEPSLAMKQYLQDWTPPRLSFLPGPKTVLHVHRRYTLCERVAKSGEGCAGKNAIQIA